MNSATLQPRPMTPATWAALVALALLLGGLALFLMGCAGVFGLTEIPDCPTGPVPVGAPCTGNHTNLETCECDCQSFGVTAVVHALSATNIRDAAASPTILGQTGANSQGTIIGGPEVAAIPGNNPDTWWQVDFDDPTVPTGWVPQRRLTLDSGPSLIAKSLLLCVPPELNANLSGGHVPSPEEVATDCSVRVTNFFTNTQVPLPLPTGAKCTCASKVVPTLWAAECDGTCADSTGVCVVMGKDPPVPTPEPLSTALVSTVASCEVSGSAEILINDRGPYITPATGLVRVEGRPRVVGQACPAGVSFQLRFADITIEGFFSDSKFHELAASGASEPQAVALGQVLGTTFGGDILAEKALTSMRGRRNSEAPVSFVGRNSGPLGLLVDWDQKYCLLEGSVGGDAKDDDGNTVTLGLHVSVGGVPTSETPGILVNQAPRPNASSTPATVECTSPQGALVTLDASASKDRDSTDPAQVNDIAVYVWRRGAPDGPFVIDPTPSPVINGLQQALGAETYYVSVVDRQFAVDQTAVTVRVVDTTPPQVSCNSPQTIGATDAPISFTATATDLCGTSSTTVQSFKCFEVKKDGRIVDRSQWCKVNAQGSTITIDKTGGVGTTIQWQLASADALGNPTTKTCEVFITKP